MGGEVPAGSPEWSWNAAWDECHGVERELRGESEGVWCAALQRGAACETPQSHGTDSTQAAYALYSPPHATDDHITNCTYNIAWTL